MATLCHRFCSAHALQCFPSTHTHAGPTGSAHAPALHLASGRQHFDLLPDLLEGRSHLRILVPTLADDVEDPWWSIIGRHLFKVRTNASHSLPRHLMRVQPLEGHMAEGDFKCYHGKGEHVGFCRVLCALQDLGGHPMLRAHALRHSPLLDARESKVCKF